MTAMTAMTLLSVWFHLYSDLCHIFDIFETYLMSKMDLSHVRGGWLGAYLMSEGDGFQPYLMSGGNGFQPYLMSEGDSFQPYLMSGWDGLDLISSISSQHLDLISCHPSYTYSTPYVALRYRISTHSSRNKFSLLF